MGERRWLVAIGLALAASGAVAIWLFIWKPWPVTRISRSFPADGIKTVILRAAEAETTEVIHVPTVSEVEISALPAGGAAGYHSPDPFWRETRPDEWGLDFVSGRHGDVLVISSKSEILYIHHCYFLKSVILRVPEGVEVVWQPRKLSGNGDPDLELPLP